MEEFFPSVPRMEPASFDYSTDVYEHSNSVEINDDFDNEKSWFNFAVNVATGMFKNNDNNNNNNNHSNSKHNHSSSSSSNSSKSSHSRRRSRHAISIWGPSSFREVSGLKDIPEESEGSLAQQVIKNEVIDAIEAIEASNDDDAAPLAALAVLGQNDENAVINNLDDADACKEGSDNGCNNGCKHENDCVASVASVEGCDDNTSVTSLENNFIDDILGQQPALAASEIVESKNFGKMNRSVSFPLLQEHLNQHEAVVSRSVYGLDLVRGPDDLVAPLQWSPDKMDVNDGNDGNDGNDSCNDCDENEIDWNVKQGGLAKNISRLLNDDGPTQEIGNYFGVHGIENGHDDIDAMQDEREEARNRVKDEKMKSAEHYHLYSRAKKLRKQAKQAKLGRMPSNDEMIGRMNENEAEEQNESTDAYNDAASVNSSNSHVSSQYNMVHVLQNRMNPHRSGSVMSAQSSGKASLSDETNFAFVSNEVNRNENGNELENETKSSEMAQDDSLAPSSTFESEMKDLKVMKGLKSPSETVKLIDSPIPQFSAKFAENSRERRKHGKRREKRDGSGTGGTENETGGDGNVSEAESNMSSNISWCVLSDK